MTRTLKIIRRITFWLTLVFIVIAAYSLTLGQIIPIEFADNKLMHNFYDIIFQGTPIAILLTLIATIQSKNSKAKNWKIVGFTVLASLLSFFVMISLMFQIGFGAWVNEAILYRYNDNPKQTINQQIWDMGALGYGRQRTVNLFPFLKYWNIVKEIDTETLNKSEWIYENEEGDIKFP